ncbi:MAG: YcxB family protein [Frisingicoccus sp.]|uniref:YcxB family protein n=1 Tax=Frisingicoccus sp. TaxID=1918627 RepID=UPI0025BAA72B|nr:YcxB family protein [Frisingicoccus sp.]MDY4835862.1 YcxB family protein [Frisingicoccus sp.]MDY5956288.1 YcxB family protein [Frisingicoccus sp.]
MEPLFQTETEYTYDEYKKYNHEILYKVRKVSRTILIMELILLAVAYMAKDLTYVVAALCVPLIFSIVFFIKAKSTYKKNPDIHNVIFTYKFYPNYIEQESALGNAVVYNSQIQKVLETKTNFYLITGSDSGLILVKRNCSSELLQYLEELKAEKAN